MKYKILKTSMQKPNIKTLTFSLTYVFFDSSFYLTHISIIVIKKYIIYKIFYILFKISHRNML